MSALEYRTRERPMHHAARHEAITWKGETFREGQSIAYDISVYETRTTDQHTERREGTVVELWIEDWHGKALPYAEVDQTDGEEQRVWFHRDHVSTDLGFAIGGAAEGGLF